MELLNNKALTYIVNDPGSGGHRKPESTSFAAIGATLVPTIVLGSIYITTFLCVRSPFRNIYAPRTFFRTIAGRDRTPSSSHTTFSWFHDYRVLDDKFILRHSSLDAYLFLRFFRFIIIICVVGCLITWAILFPVNATSDGGATQLDRISFSNINDPNRCYAHAVVAWIFLGFVIVLITRERLFAITIRQAYASIKPHATRLSSRIVVFLTAPPEVFKEGQLQKYFGPDAKRCWKVANLKELEDLVSERANKVEELEKAELHFLQSTSKHNSSAAQKARSQNGRSSTNVSDSNPSTRSRRNWPAPIAKQFDQVEKAKRELVKTTSRITSLREAQSRNPKRAHAIIVEFKDQVSAHEASQQIRHHSPLALRPRFVGVQPKEILWQNLTLNPSTRISYYYLAIAFVVATIIFWSIPIGIIGTVSNIKNLTDKVHWLSFVDDLPAPILGFLTGFVPPYILSEVVSYVPKFFRKVAKWSGQPTTIEAEKLTQTWYLLFQVIQVFLVTTFTSGAAAVVTQIINEPTKTPELLAQNLPKASNFYLAYFTVQGIATSAKNLINYSDLAFYVFYDRYLCKTPRDKYNNYSQMKGIGWGSVLPKFTNFAIIAIAYSCIAPLMLGFAAVGLYLYYLLYRYNLLYVIQVKLDTRGACYSRALQHIMIGVYLAELCLLGLFSIQQAAGPDILMVILLIGTIVYHITVNKYLGPLEQTMPLDSLLSEDEEQPLLLSGSPSQPATGRPVDSETADETEDSDDQQPSFHPYFRAAAKSTHSSILHFPLPRFLVQYLHPSVAELRTWLQSDTEDLGISSSSSSEPPKYTDEELDNAYQNPAMTSKTPKIWLPKDKHEISSLEIDEAKKDGLPMVDQGAELSPDGKDIRWNHEDFETVPIFKAPSKI